MQHGLPTMIQFSERIKMPCPVRVSTGEKINICFKEEMFLELLPPDEEETEVERFPPDVILRDVQVMGDGKVVNLLLADGYILFKVPVSSYKKVKV